MRPIILKGHERAITFLKYNREGDLIVTCSKDNHPTLWLTETGERIGTYEGHAGSVWSADISFHSEFLLTASADQYVKLWNVRTGEELYSWKHTGPVRTVAFAEGDREFLTVTDPYAGKPAEIRIYKFEDDPSLLSEEPRSTIFAALEGGARLKVTNADWVKMNAIIVTSSESGALRTYDSETGEMYQEVRDHKGAIKMFALNKERTALLTASTDTSARLYDVSDLEKCMKIYETDRPINSVAISPIKDHVLLGGGQEAADVTTTSASSGKMDVRLHHMIFGVELARIKGHFGPVNTCAFHPSGNGYASGGEDGYVRLHVFDKEYFTLGEKLVPDEKRIAELKAMVEADPAPLPDSAAAAGAGGGADSSAAGAGGAGEV